MNAQHVETVRIDYFSGSPLLRLYQQLCLGQLAQLLIHEFNNALTSLSGYAQMALAIKREDILLKAAHNFNDVTGQLHQLVQNIHSLTRTDLEVFEPLDPKQSALQAHKVLDHHLSKRNIRLHVTGEAAHMVTGHPVLLTLAMLTFVLDARDRLLAEGGGGEIRIELAGSGPCAVVAFSDSAVKGSGLGTAEALPPLDAARLADPRREFAALAFHAIAAAHGGRVHPPETREHRVIRMEIPYHQPVPPPTG